MRHTPPRPRTRARAALIPLVALGTLFLAACGALAGSDDTADLATRAPHVPATPGPIPDELQVDGLFSDPRLRDADRIAELGPRPASPFPTHDGSSVVLYDIRAGEGTRFGTGPTGLFTSDGAFLAWTEFSTTPGLPTILRRVDLVTGDVADLGTSGTLIQYEGGGVVRIAAPTRDGEFLVNLANGARLPAGPAEIYAPPQLYRLTEERFDGVTQRRFTLWDGATPLLRFDALRATIDAQTTLIALVASEGTDANIFLIDIETRAAEFIATTAAEPSAIPIAANTSHVVWTPNYCAAQPGLTRLYDRQTGQLTELTDARLYVGAFTPDGRLVDGPFGGEALIDPATLTWDTVLPPSPGDTIWSPNYSYASRATTFGVRPACP